MYGDLEANNNLEQAVAYNFNFKHFLKSQLREETRVKLRRNRMNTNRKWLQAASTETAGKHYSTP